MSRSLWRRFLDATRERGARPLVERALSHVEGGGRALDLGCGGGGDTLALLEAGLDVLAIDALPEAVERTRERAAAAGLAERLAARVVRFEDLALEPSTLDLAVASFSLPFCPPERFDALWGGLARALTPGGVLVGQLFGDRDAWAADDDHPARVFLTRAQVDACLAPFEVLHFEEEEERRATALGDVKDWHLFHFIARKS